MNYEQRLRELKVRLNGEPDKHKREDIRREINKLIELQRRKAIELQRRKAIEDQYDEDR